MKKKIKETKATFKFYDYDSDSVVEDVIYLYNVPEKSLKKAVEKKTGKKVLKILGISKDVIYEFSVEDLIKIGKRLNESSGESEEKDGE